MYNFSIFFWIFLLASCSALDKKLGIEEDNLGEEITEEVIKIGTGVSVDLTPDSEED